MDFIFHEKVRFVYTRFEMFTYNNALWTWFDQLIIALFLDL